MIAVIFRGYFHGCQNVDAKSGSTVDNFSVDKYWCLKNKQLSNSNSDCKDRQLPMDREQ